MSELKPCPFCGGGKLTWVRDPEDCCEIRGIYCRECKALVRWNILPKQADTFGKTEEQWAGKWNRRANNE